MPGPEKASVDASCAESISPRKIRSDENLLLNWSKMSDSNETKKIKANDKKCDKKKKLLKHLTCIKNIT